VERTRRAFTLVELLVITAVGLMLLAIVFAVLQQKREHERRRARCIGNLKHIGLAMRLYSGDNKERFPTDQAATTIGSFALLTNTYQTAYKVWTCRADIGVTAGSPTQPFTRANVSFAYGGFGLTETVQPDTPLACDRTTGNITSANPWSGNKWTHRSTGGFVVYADGHVAWVTNMEPPMYRGKNP